MGKTAGSTVIRPSKRIIYDTKEAVVSFLSEDPTKCVPEFLEEWARVSKMVVIAREVAQMAKQSCFSGVRLLSFDLQTVEFAYIEVCLCLTMTILRYNANDLQDYMVSISCEDHRAIFKLRFSRCKHPPGEDVDMDHDDFNPHEDAELLLSNILQHGDGRLAPSLQRLVTVMRETLPIAVVLEEIRRECEGEVPVDTYAKSAGWYRLLYGDFRYETIFSAKTSRLTTVSCVVMRWISG